MIHEIVITCISNLYTDTFMKIYQLLFDITTRVTTFLEGMFFFYLAMVLPSVDKVFLLGLNYNILCFVKLCISINYKCGRYASQFSDYNNRPYSR